MVERGRIGELELHPDLARRVLTPLGDAWVIPDDGYTGLAVHGLVPAGVDEVTLLGANGASTTAVVTENVYGAALAGPFKSQRFGGPIGPVEFGIG